MATCLSFVTYHVRWTNIPEKYWRWLKKQIERTPVRFKREFLDQYRPNESSYLTPETISYLTRIGATPDVERPAGTYARHILNRLLVDLSRTSSRLEGNTYSLLDTERLIELGEAAE